MLFGTYFHQIDVKGRVRIPVKLKTSLGKNSMVTRGTNGCLFLFSQEELQTTIYDKLTAVPISDTVAATPLRVLFSSAEELEEDNQGRTMIPMALRKHANLKKDIVFIGVGNRAEIWSREDYDKQFGDINFDKALESLKGYGV